MVWFLKQWVFQQHECGSDCSASRRVLDGISCKVRNEPCSCAQQRGCHGCIVCEAVVDCVHGLEIDGHIAVADL